MATKFGYVERNLENDVNWANVGKGFSDMLLAERDERKAKKGALNDAMQQTQEGLRKNAPLGYNTDFNDRMIGLAANSSAFVLAANKDLKAGRITPEEYMRKLHRVNSSADTTFALANNYNTIYEDKLKRMDAKDSGNVEQAAFEAMSKLVDFNKHDFMIDENGTIVAAPLITDENGITSLDTKNARSVQAIFNLAQNTVNRFDVEGTVAESVARLGKVVLGTSLAATYGKQGMDVLIEGIKAAKPKKYAKWKEETTSKIMADKFDVASILTDFSDEYETTTDKKKWLANKDKYVYVDIENGKEILIGELTDEQKAKAIDILDGVIESQVGSSRKEKASPRREYQLSKIKYFKNLKDGDKASEEISTLWNQVGYGTTEEKARALESLLGNKHVMAGGVLGIKSIKDGKFLKFIYKDSDRNRSIDLTKTYTPMEWAEIGSEIHGVSDLKKAVSAGGGWKEGVAFTTVTDENSPFKGIGSLREGAIPKEDVDVAYSNIIGQNINKSSTSEDISSFLNGIGITARASQKGVLGSYGGGEQTIIIEDTAGVETEYKLNDAGLKAINNIVTSSASKEEKELAIKTIASSGSASGSGVDAFGNPI